MQFRLSPDVEALPAIHAFNADARHAPGARADGTSARMTTTRFTTGVTP